MLTVGDTAPLDIEVLDEQSRPITLRSLLGNYVVLYFYPKDNTPGCTKEACNFRDANVDLKKLGVQVIGISKDSATSHHNFKQRHNLNFPLWSDKEHKLLSAFGAWGEKKSFGKLFMGIIRSTFIIDPQGKIVKTWEKVNPANHQQEVLEFFEKR